MDLALHTRIKQLCKDHSITMAKLENDIGLSSAVIRTWKGGVAPSADKVAKIARYFNVSIDYLLGNSDIPTTLSDYIGDAEIISLQRARARMSPSDRQRMMAMLRAGFDYAFNDESDAPER